MMTNMKIHIKHILFIALMIAASTLGASASVLDSLS